MAGQFTFKKKERLTHKATLDQLFRSGIQAYAYPIKFICLISKREKDDPAVKVAFSVPRKAFKKAVDRNLLRRRMKESYRLYKYTLFEKLDSKEIQLLLMMIYVDRNILDYHAIEKGMVKGMKRILQMI